MAITETAALYDPAGPGPSERQVKETWWRQVFAPETRARFPRIRMINWFEWRKDEAEVHAVIDWRMGADPALAADLLAEVPPGWLGLAPVGGCSGSPSGVPLERRPEGDGDVGQGPLVTRAEAARAVRGERQHADDRPVGGAQGERHDRTRLEGVHEREVLRRPRPGLELRGARGDVLRLARARGDPGRPGPDGLECGQAAREQLALRVAVCGRQPVELTVRRTRVDDDELAVGKGALNERLDLGEQRRRLEERLAADRRPVCRAQRDGPDGGELLVVPRARLGSVDAESADHRWRG
jgi:hypothetical protein